MPTYDYECPRCGGFDARRAISERDEPCACPECGSPSPRVLAFAPQLTCTSEALREAHATNERARHAPRSSRDTDGAKSHHHPPGCGCCSGRKSRTVTAANGAKAFPGKRPWMISH